jgi:hypothetical protein
MNATFRARSPVIRIALPYLFSLSDELDRLERLPDLPEKYRDVWFPLFMAESAIYSLTANSLYAPYLRSSQSLGQQLVEAIRAVNPAGGGNGPSPDAMDSDVPPHKIYTVKHLYSQYKIALLAELGALNVYFVTQKGGFDTYTLLTAGERLFPTELAAKVPEAMVDAREAAKALAFELPTACGFHTFRVIESVLRKYYAHVTGGAAQPKVRNVGVYLNALKQAGKGDPKLLAALKQTSDLHRNPLIHPDVVLSPEEAVATLGMAHSIITAMIAVLPNQPLTTTTPQSIAPPGGP